VRVVATSSLPIDLASQLARAGVPPSEISIPSAGHVALAERDLSTTEALICLLVDRVDAAVLARAPALRVVACCAVGLDHVDLAAATARGVWVTHTPDVLTEATAELTVALLLAAARRLGEGERLVRSGAWRGWALDQLLGCGLTGKLLGIVGLGRIGLAVARRAAALGMRVAYAGPREAAAAPGPRLPLDELFATADAVSLHCPLTPATARLVDARRLALMKPTAILVNTARGGCVDEPALIAALEAGRLFGAALDVYDREPALDPRLLSCPRLTLAPHIGSATTEARIQMAQLCADSVLAVLAGRRPAHVANPEAARAAPAPRAAPVPPERA
jgi:glyoxylate reductase